MSNHEALRQLYQDVLMKHASEPRGFKQPIEATHRAEGVNTLCGDEVDLAFRVVNGVIQEAAFTGASCAICMASASLLCENLPGQPLEAVTENRDGYAAAIRTGETEGCPEYLHAMIRVRRYPARVECAMLPWDTAVEAVEAGEQGNED